jgi:2,7-dihydroxy-5-methyl-1-naphthoate 7-O-methyltransferase
MADDSGWGGTLWMAADLVTPMAVRVAATLRLADHIAAGTTTADELAAVTGADADALGRVMDHLVTAGLLDRTDSDYGLTGLGEQLRDDHPGGVRAWIDLEGAVGYADLCMVELLHTVRTGEAAYPRRYGRPYWEDLAADPARAATFDALMSDRLRADAAAIASAYPWGELGHLVDVGGGDGTLLIAILEAHTDLRGTVVDLPGPVSRAGQALAAAGLLARADAKSGSFFNPLPAGAGGYLLSGVLHDWPDGDALRILRRCAEAAPDSGKVLVLEDNVGDAETGTPHTEGDLRMLAYCRGRDRTVDQLGDLAGSAGLTISSVIPAGMRSIIELLQG